MHLPAPPVYEQTNWLYFIALSKHRIWNELFVRKMAALCFGVSRERSDFRQEAFKVKEI